MGDKSPKSKERGQKQKSAAKVTGNAKLADKQLGYRQDSKTGKR